MNSFIGSIKIQSGWESILKNTNDTNPAGGVEPLAPKNKFTVNTISKAVRDFADVFLSIRAAYQIWVAITSVAGGAVMYYLADLGKISVQNFYISIACLSIVLLFITIRYFLISRHLTKLLSKALKDLNTFKATQTNRSMRFDKAGRHIASLARENAINDVALFQQFNSVMLEETATRQTAVSAANIIIDEDIQKILNKLCDVLSAITNDECATCIKLINGYGLVANGDLEDAKLQTLYRDSESSSDRDHADGKEYGLLENTISTQILLEREQCWGNDDLKALHAQGGYSNSRDGWEKCYNATVGVGIRLFRPHGPPNIACGILCADNFAGGLTDRRCQEYMLAASWRISVMIYRLNCLRPEEKLLKGSVLDVELSS